MPFPYLYQKNPILGNKLLSLSLSSVIPRSSLHSVVIESLQPSLQRLPTQMCESFHFKHGKRLIGKMLKWIVFQQQCHLTLRVNRVNSWHLFHLLAKDTLGKEWLKDIAIPSSNIGEICFLRTQTKEFDCLNIKI